MPRKPRSSVLTTVAIDERLISEHGDSISSPHYCPLAWWLRENGFAGVNIEVDIHQVLLGTGEELGDDEVVELPPEFRQWQLEGIRDRQSLQPIMFEVDLPEPPHPPVRP